VILQVLHTLNVGGAEVLAARLARRMRDRFHFVFACLDELGTLGQELRDERFVVEVLGRRAGIDLGCVRQLARVAEKHQAEVIHAHQYTPFFYSRAPGWLGRRPSVLFTEHGRDFPDVPNRKRRIFNRLFLRSIDRVVAVGEAVKRALIVNEGIPTQRIEVIYNGVRLEDFSTDAALRREVRGELGIGATDPVAIQVARLDYLKDHSTALRTAQRIRNKLPDFKLLLVGEGPERAKIEQEIMERQLGATVRLLGLRSDVRQLLASADMFLLTSISEGIPVTFIEAMGAGLPVVSTAVGGVEEVVVPGETGLLAPAGDDEQLANSVLQLFEEPAKAHAMGKMGSERARQLFSERQMHEGYAAVYEQLAESRRPKHRRLAGAT
jgi:glycosyltransferase involved in cell wall biosynthesis